MFFFSFYPLSSFIFFFPNPFLFFLSPWFSYSRLFPLFMFPPVVFLLYSHVSSCDNCVFFLLFPLSFSPTPWFSCHLLLLISSFLISYFFYLLFLVSSLIPHFSPPLLLSWFPLPNFFPPPVSYIPLPLTFFSGVSFSPTLLSSFHPLFFLSSPSLSPFRFLIFPFYTLVFS